MTVLSRLTLPGSGLLWQLPPAGKERVLKRRETAAAVVQISLKKDFTSGDFGDVLGEVFGDFDVDLRSPSFEV